MIFLIRDIAAYLKHPYLARLPAKVEDPFGLLWRLTLICLILGIGSGVFIDRMVALKLLASPGPSRMEHLTMPMGIFFLMAVVVGPVGEELLFRAQLRRFTLTLFFIALIPGAILTQLTGTSWAYMVSPFIFSLLFLVYRINLSGSITLKYGFWVKVFPWHFHLTAVCFALIHLGNFEKGISLLPFGLLYTLPQLAIGLILGYTRMNYGLKYAMALHGLYNFFPVALFIFSKH